MILPEVNIGQHARISNAIIERGVKIPAHFVVGEDPEADRKRGIRVTDGGIRLITPKMIADLEP